MGNFIKNIIITVTALIIIVLVMINIVFPTIRWIGNKGKISVTSKASLEKILTVNELQTIECVYNSYVIVYKGIDYEETLSEDATDDEIKITTKKDEQYAISYRGYVTAGIDESPTVTINDKAVYINIPDAKILDCYVVPDPNTMKFLYLQNKYKKQTDLKKDLNICTNDLRSKVQDNKDILALANQNAINAIKALCMPLKNHSSYKFVIAGETL